MIYYPEYAREMQSGKKENKTKQLDSSILIHHVLFF